MPLQVGVIANTRYTDLRPVLATAVSDMVSRGWELYGDPELARLSGHEMLPFRAEGIDLLVTFGGDGTLLRGARALEGQPIPVLGVNFGRVGFLTTVSREEVAEALNGFALGRHWVSRRSMIEGTVSAVGMPEIPVRALNDVVLHKGGVARVVRFDIRVDGDLIGTVSGDGVVIASPTGSTAYSLSAGGPVVAPTIDALVITPICAHSLSVRPVVVPSSATVRIEPLQPENENLLVSFDGQQTAPLPPGAGLSVRVPEERIHLVRFPEVTFFQRLREKLHWGDLSGRS